MRYYQIENKIKEEQEKLDEVAMSPSALKAFANSAEAEGMMAGFEAELVFEGLGSDSSEPEWEPDYDSDERASSIEQVIDFFSSGYWSDLSTREQNSLRNRMTEDYYEWVSEKVSEYWEENQEELITDWVDDNDLFDEESATDEAKLELENQEEIKPDSAEWDLEIQALVAAAKERFIQDIIDEGYSNNIYEAAYDNLRETMSEDFPEDDWFDSQSLRYMTDVSNQYDISWPHYQQIGGGNEDGYNEENADRLADSLSEELGVKTRAASGYHSAKRDNETWIFEPDGSLEASDSDDMPVEIVSPPMPLKDAVEIMPKFFAWAVENGAYANKSTGFHMSVSMPGHEREKLDYTKLALFLGDEHVLKQFGREANTYTSSALGKIKKNIKSENVEAVLEKMKTHLNEFASRSLAEPSGFGKYTSINPKDKYIEFRSAGGGDYFSDIERIQNTLLRYARALSIAMNPESEKQEYAKKLYKMLGKVETEKVVDPKTGKERVVAKSTDASNDAISIFSRYVAGELPKSALKSFVKQLQYQREKQKQITSFKFDDSKMPPVDWNGNYEIYNIKSDRTIYPFKADFGSDAMAVFDLWKKSVMNPTLDPANFALRPVRPSGSSSSAETTPAGTLQSDQGEITVGSLPINNPRGVFVIRRRQDDSGTGPVLYRFDAPNNREAVEIARRWSAARGFERHTVWLDHVNSLSPEELGTQSSSTQEEYPFLIVYSIGANTGPQNRSTYRVNAPNQLAARQQFLQTARQSVDLDRITIHDVEQL